jgi:ArsR family transcriptional regulator
MPYRAEPVHVAKAALFRSLGHPARVRILELLRDGEQTVGALQEALALDSGGTSQHLAALRRVGLVEARRAGTSVYYSASDARTSVLLATARELVTRHLEQQQLVLRDFGDA